jgi:hypothetical protein
MKCQRMAAKSTTTQQIARAYCIDEADRAARRIRRCASRTAILSCGQSAGARRRCLAVSKARLGSSGGSPSSMIAFIFKK